MFKELLKDARTILALVIALFSILGITTLSIVYIVVSPNNEKKDAASQVFNGILPIYGTWVGTLLAFYFAKENLDSATQIISQSNTSASNNLESILVSETISNKFVSVKSPEEESMSLEDLKKLLVSKGRRRLPILNEKGALRQLVYYQEIDEYLLSLNDGGKKATLKDFIEANQGKSKAIVYVQKDISLAKANEERKRIVDCQDIIVTDTGKQDGKVIGYLTNVDIDKYSRL